MNYRITLVCNGRTTIVIVAPGTMRDMIVAAKYVARENRGMLHPDWLRIYPVR